MRIMGVRSSWQVSRSSVAIALAGVTILGAATMHLHAQTDQNKPDPHLADKTQDDLSDMTIHAPLVFEFDSEGKIAGCELLLAGETSRKQHLKLLQDLAQSTISKVNMAYSGKNVKLTIEGTDLPEDILRAAVFGDKQAAKGKPKKKDVTGPVRIEQVEGTDIVITRGRKEDVERVQQLMEDVKEKATSESSNTAPLTGPVQIEFIEGTDIFLTRGRKEDVDRVQKIIKDVEEKARQDALKGRSDATEITDAIAGPWDVDNSGSGVADSVSGLAPVAGPDGRLYKPLAAIALEFNVADQEASIKSLQASLEDADANYSPQVKKLREEILLNEKKLLQIESTAKRGRESTSYVNVENELRTQRAQLKLKQLADEAMEKMRTQVARVRARVDKGELNVELEFAAELDRMRSLWSSMQERYKELREKGKALARVEVTKTNDGLVVKGSKEDVERAEQIVIQGKEGRRLAPNAKVQVSYEIPSDAAGIPWRLLVDRFLAGKGIPKENVNLKFWQAQEIGRIQSKEKSILTVEGTHAATEQLDSFLKSLGAKFYVNEKAPSLVSYRLQNPISKQVVALLREYFTDAIDLTHIQSKGPYDLIIKATKKQHENIAEVIKLLDVAKPDDQEQPDVQVHYLKFVAAKDAANVLKMLFDPSPNLKIIVDERVNSLSVHGSPKVHNRVNRYLKSIDVPVETSESRALGLRIQLEEMKQRFGKDHPSMRVLMRQIEVAEKMQTDSETHKDSPVTNGHKLYQLHCVHCHGEKGLADGKTAPFLNPPPRNFASGKFKHVRTESADAMQIDIAKLLKSGVPGTAMPSYTMLSDDERSALANHVSKLVASGKDSAATRKEEPTSSDQTNSTKRALLQQVEKQVKILESRQKVDEADLKNARVQLKFLPKLTPHLQFDFRKNPPDPAVFLRFPTEVERAMMMERSMPPMAPIGVPRRR